MRKEYACTRAIIMDWLRLRRRIRRASKSFWQKANFESEAVRGVEDAGDAEVTEVTTKQFPVDDVPLEYPEAFRLGCMGCRPDRYPPFHGQSHWV